MSLPLPSTSSSYRPRHTPSSSSFPYSSLLTTPSTSTRPSPLLGSQQSFSLVAYLSEKLRTRARLTNLAVYLLTLSFVLSFLLNLRWVLFDQQLRISSLRTGSHGDWARPESIEKTIERTQEMRNLDHLVIVAGHAIWIGTDPDLRERDDQWILSPIQKGGSVKTFYKHIEAGVNLTLNDPNALLLLSGSSTRPTSPLTEATSYLSLLLSSALLPPPPEFVRVSVEEFALDSFENLLFGLGRFWEVVGRWPREVTVVGFGMKQARFEELHRAAIKFPKDRFHYIGIDDEGDTRDNYEGEYKYGYLPFTHDASGCHPPLSTKKLSRNPFSKYHPYHTSVPELRGLLEWCPDRGEVVYPGWVPWGEEEETGGNKGAGAGGWRMGREED